MSADPTLKPSPLTNPHLAKWHASNYHSEWLTGVLESEEGKLLLDVLGEFAIPKHTVNLGQISDPNALEAYLKFSGVHHSGLYAAIVNLRGLAYTIEELQPLGEPWAGGENTEDS